jgi:hypothetical protein
MGCDKIPMTGAAACGGGELVLVVVLEMIVDDEAVFDVDW